MKNSAQTPEGHINHELATVHDYLGRAVYEFFQNAVDRADKRIWFHLDTANRSLLIANDGHPFSYSDRNGSNYTDLESVCSINTSSKNANDSIGNKGVGFKSCWEYASEVSVTSKQSDGSFWGFRLHRDLKPETLHRYSHQIPKFSDWRADADIHQVVQRRERVPSFYFPEIHAEIPPTPKGLESAVTLIRWEDIDVKKMGDLEAKLREFASHPLFFVSQLPKLKEVLRGI